MTREFDSPWKDTLDEFLDSALELFHPQLYAAVDWSLGYETLDAELSEILRDAEIGPRDADRLFRVTLKSGTALRLLIHAEVQSQHDPELPRRMFVYHYRLKDRYDEPLVGVAILGDESQTWRPTEYNYNTFGTSILFQFHTVKLIDWRGQFEDLLQGSNPVGVVIAAHLQSLVTHGEPESRYHAKWQIVRTLFDRGWTAERIRKMYRLIDWLLELPLELQQQLRTSVQNFQEGRKMPYIVSDERLAKEEGRVEGRVSSLLDGLEVVLRLKFPGTGQAFADELRRQPPSLDQLDRLLKSAEAAASVDDLKKLLAE